MKQITWLSALDPPERFPAADQALDEPAGLLAAGGDLSTERLIAAYARGIFPWYSPGQPVLWWTPDPREVLYPGEFRLARSLARTIRRGALTTTMDQAFDAVIEACSGPRRGLPGTWITPEMRAAYERLHRLGHAHSFETWADGELVGGLYGVRSGTVFCGESMFSRRADASKVALARLVQECAPLGIELIDCQLNSQHLRSLGSRAIPRLEFLEQLRK
ncbi:MAG: leucyl/phenylalanyl-tRNA--protein transferase [Steroidobacteraceae bacterium]